MKEVVKITSVLTSVCIICAFLLSFVYGLANKKIEVNEQKRISEAIYNIAPDVKTTKEMGGTKEPIYQLYDDNDNLTGYAFLAQGQGYQGKIKMIAVVTPSFDQLRGIEIVESVETPGLGSRIQEKDFIRQFQDLNISKMITGVKSDQKKAVDDNKAGVKNNQIQTITGATISSNAVINILNKRITELKEVIK